MTSRVYKMVGEECVEILGLPKEVEAAAIHQDTLETPLRHPVTGRIHTSRSEYMRDCDRTGTRVVGNDWVGLEPTKPKDKITDALILDKIQKAEAIHRDPARLRERENENRMRFEHAQRFMSQGRIPVERLRD